MGEHKYKTEGSSYWTKTFCEWCGWIIHDANDSVIAKKAREKENKKHVNCPNTPTNNVKGDS